MSDANAQTEPTMEEILSSIRRIISEDDEPPVEKAEEEPASVDEILDAEPEPEPVAEVEPEPEPEPAPEPAPVPEPTPEPEPEDDDDVLELDQMLEEDGSITDLSGGEGDDDLVFEDEPVPMPEPPPMPAPDMGRLISDHAAADASASLAALTRQVTAQRDISVPTLRTLEDITKELLRPMLKEWLDANLPSITQRIVEREIAKLAGEVDDNKH
jgi:cell pole-organizing protein PopZ